MRKRIKIILQRALFTLLPFFLLSNAAADETIIQSEKISFEKCLEVIAISQNKLLIAPKIIDVSAEKRIAVFMLVDGQLTIKCDGEEGNVIVTTNTN